MLTEHTIVPCNLGHSTKRLVIRVSMSFSVNAMQLLRWSI